MTYDPAARRERDIRRILGVVRSSQATDRGFSATDISGLVVALDQFGFAGVSETSFYPSVAAAEKLSIDATLAFSSSCCVCGAPVAQRLAPVEVRGFFKRLAPGPLVACIPHCAEHAASGHAILIVHVETAGPTLCQVYLAGLSADFLASARRLNQVRDQYPPWRAFPQAGPESSGWRQGPGEHWLRHAWQPFWTALDAQERDGYLLRWDAPQSWRSWLATESVV